MAGNFEIVNLLLEKGLITQEQLTKAQDEVKRTGLSLDRALEKLGFISEDDIASALAVHLNVPFMDLKDYIIDSELVKLIPENIAKKYKVVPLFMIGQSLTVAMVNPQDIVALDQVRKVSKKDSIDPVLTTEKGIQRILDYYYVVGGSISEIVKSIETKKVGTEEEKDLSEIVEEAPVIKLVNMMFMQAVKDRASDIHVEPEHGASRVRNRIDGIMHEAYTFPKHLHRAIASRIKLLSGMDIAESRKPQDGRIRLKVQNKDLDVRVSTFPTIHGENVVMRLLDKSAVVLGLEDLGFDKDELTIFDKLIRHPNGIILVTGPTGSGKTTTLYSTLSTISTMEKNIITIEDPVEYELPLIRQTQVNPRAGITFADGLRAILRQDPDIIMVGEIRDKETAEIAIQASLTGHLVLSTLHTNDAPSSLARLIDMGVEPFLISSSVIGILAQRLVRKICEKCKEKYSPDASVLKDLGMAPKQELYRGKGCPECKNTGYRGRIGVYEMLLINDAIREMINNKASADQIMNKAVESGMKALYKDGLEKAIKGITTAEEVLRVTKVE
ncbi:MAG: type II secretion system ATPase GspE [Candidatus Omnitrophota bacterium]